jgi:environmental stress-induced protein Ves
MIEIITPAQFKTIPWKNGQGETTELAINESGSLDNFDWRLSIASVVKDGVFSNFDGYYRNLVLIEGEGLSLTHDEQKTDVLKKRLDVASFSGGCKTFGKLTHGAIKDFNIITRNEKISPTVHCYLEDQQIVVKLSATDICFAYSLTDDIAVEPFEHENLLAPVGHLVKLSAQNNVLKGEPLSIRLTGKNMIIVQFEVMSE